MDSSADIIGEVLWFGGLASPFLIIPLTIYRSKLKIGYRIILGVFISVGVLLVCCSIGLAICFRNGMGP